MFKKKSDASQTDEKKEKSGKGSIENNPYIAARREWVERYASFEQQADRWRIIAFVAMATAIIAVLFVGYIGSQTKFIPYVIEVDSTGNAMATGLAQKEKPMSEHVIRAQLKGFVNGIYVSISDKEYQKRIMENSYAMLMPGSVAEVKFVELYKARNPMEMKENVRVVDAVVLHQSNQTYQVEFAEEYRDDKGFLDHKIKHRMIVTIRFVNPGLEYAQKNPTGIEIVDFDIQKL